MRLNSKKSIKPNKSNTDSVTGQSTSHRDTDVKTSPRIQSLSQFDEDATAASTRNSATSVNPMISSRLLGTVLKTSKSKQKRVRFSEKVIMHEPDASSSSSSIVQELPLGTFAPGTSSEGRIVPEVPVIWIMGGPCAGKDTQSDMIGATLGFTVLGWRQIMRSNPQFMAKDIWAGNLRGKHFSPTMVVKLFRDAMAALIGQVTGFIINDFPQEMSQAVLFEDMVCNPSALVFLDVTCDTLHKRMSSMYGATLTGSQLKELLDYGRDAQSVLQHYSNILVRVNGEETPRQIHDKVILRLRHSSVPALKESVKLAISGKFN